MSIRNRPGFIADTQQWAQAVFGQCELGDIRRTKRAVALTARMAADPAASVHAACSGDDAAVEGSYRFLNNDNVKDEDLEEGPFRYAAESCQGRPLVLAIQDTTDLVYPHAVSEQLGDLGGGRGLVVHSVLAVDAETREVIGLLGQQRWIRPDKRPGKDKRKKRPYKEKESYKWECASQSIRRRLGAEVDVIDVSDREADIYEYLQRCNQKDDPWRHVVRAFQPRKLTGNDEALRENLQKQPLLGTYEVQVEQRGPMRGEYGQPDRPGRSAHTITMELRSATVELQAPQGKGEPLNVNVVYARQSETGEGALEWILFTSESVSTLDGARTVVGYYEKRWLIEEFHKAWKSGCKIQQSRLQKPARLERLAIITAQIAVRLLQLRCQAQQASDAPCDSLLDEDEWQCLFATTNPNKPMTDFPPTFLWAVRAIAKLGGWRDTKRTGKIGWAAMWKGWFRFQERLVAWKAAKALWRKSAKM